MRRINRSEERKNKRRQGAAESKFMRELRSPQEQLELLDKRPGQSLRERQRLVQKLS